MRHLSGSFSFGVSGLSMASTTGCKACPASSSACAESGLCRLVGRDGCSFTSFGDLRFREAPELLSMLASCGARLWVLPLTSVETVGMKSLIIQNWNQCSMLTLNSSWENERQRCYQTRRTWVIDFRHKEEGQWHYMNLAECRPDFDIS
jgi:hypothetical protein